jgi:hypothetical protein
MLVRLIFYQTYIVTPSVWGYLFHIKLELTLPESKGMRTCFAAHNDVDSVFYGLQRSLSVQFFKIESRPKKRPIYGHGRYWVLGVLPNTIGTSERTGTHTGLFWWRVHTVPHRRVWANEECQKFHRRHWDRDDDDETFAKHIITSTSLVARNERFKRWSLNAFLLPALLRLMQDVVANNCNFACIATKKDSCCARASTTRRGQHQSTPINGSSQCRLLGISS